MSPHALRGMAGGIALCAGVIWVTYALSPEATAEPVTIVEQEELEISEMMTALQEAGYYVSAEAPPEEPVVEEPQTEEMDSPTEEDSAAEEEALIDENLPESVTVETVNVYSMTLSITSGTSSHDVANQLEQAKIIDSASEFLRYLERNNLAEKVRAGDFDVNSAMSYQDIANRIT
ncbi:hypothetical protein BTR22_19280 [Alkalihalophilus pseudofirmus]|uniref:endolytic transglycosylase MltG n=1 Tax=Alkalihalophilus pseudofirmus TaxID=79885 RepID=UPI00095112B4|nr:endolytic transglycosylase MltG [Alkalihalophilus pseudofirmus]OLS34082.1 hypothetical protein BTR22_19280 [Alkalihalophilus pseudofirmus]WEG18055.1 endolytic transglycosylase MltG [Alkalihalophilus pseudofirmus]